jgi:hypothetical protein
VELDTLSPVTIIYSWQYSDAIMVISEDHLIITELCCDCMGEDKAQLHVGCAGIHKFYVYIPGQVVQAV